MTTPADPPAKDPPTIREFEARDGLRLRYRAWDAAEPRAIVRIVHGLGEHGGRYQALAEVLVERGISCCALDLRGHGTSGGRRGHAPSFHAILDDLAGFTRETAVGGRPAFLLGHSLGGLVALRGIQEGRAGVLGGAILSAPALALVGDSPWRRPAGALLSRLLPALGLPNGIPPEHLSHDPAAVSAYVDDPLVHDRISPRLYVEMLAAMRSAARDAPEVILPVLLLVPGDDRVTDARTALAVADRFSGEVAIRSYPAFYHEPFHEQGREKVFADVAAWLEERID
jgi:alpha-beta hydrolase superfamily lysophospholipase